MYFALYTDKEFNIIQPSYLRLVMLKFPCGVTTSRLSTCSRQKSFSEVYKTESVRWSEEMNSCYSILFYHKLHIRESDSVETSEQTEEMEMEVPALGAVSAELEGDLWALLQRATNRFITRLPQVQILRLSVCLIVFSLSFTHKQAVPPPLRLLLSLSNKCLSCISMQAAAGGRRPTGWI